MRWDRALAVIAAVAFFGSGAWLLLAGGRSTAALVTLVVSTIGLYVLGWLRPQAWRPKPLAPPRLDERGVACDVGDGRTEWIAWADLTEVAIVTTDDGPYGEDMFFVLLDGEGKGCVVPNADATPLVERLDRLPRFDARQVSIAAACTKNARFTCWKGTAGEATVCAAPPAPKPAASPVPPPPA